MRTKSFTRALAAKFLNELGTGALDGHCPFVRNAAQRAGLNDNSVEQWIRNGTQDPDSPEGEFATEVRRRQAVWKGAAEMAMAGKPPTDREELKAHGERVKNLQWLVTRLDRATYDLSRPALFPPKGTSEKPAHKQAKTPEQIERDLLGDENDAPALQ